MHALNPSFPAAVSSLGHHLASLLQIVWAALAAASGRTTLEDIHIPEGVTEVSARTRRLVRQAQVSAW